MQQRFLYRQWYRYRNNNRWDTNPYKNTYMLSFNQFCWFYGGISVFWYIQLWQLYIWHMGCNMYSRWV
jgi:hypothetical protein